MHVARWTGAALLCLIAAAGARAQQPETYSPVTTTAVKIAFVDVERAVATIDEGRARLKELEEWARPRQQELARQAKELDDLQAEAASKQGVSNEEALDQLNRMFTSKKRDFEDNQRVAKRDFEEKQTGVLRDLGSKLQDVIGKYGDQNRFTVIFIIKPNEIAYLANTADITETIIKLYNQRFPWAAKPAATPAK
jgi:outer membrane protein